jgi:glycerol-3-phosphate acyltransferase PlsY
MDMLKGCCAVWLGGLIGGLLAPSAAPDDMRALAALVAVLGHIFPVWLGFKGGKGVATGFGVFLVASPWAALAAISVFFVVLALSRYVSLASILGAGSFPIFAWWLGRIHVCAERSPFFVAVEIVVALLLIVKHHQNIRRLLAGTESRMGANKTT